MINYQEMNELEIVRRVGDLVGVSWADLGENYNPLCIWVDGDLEVFDPITSWADAGPIIQANKIPLNPFRDEWVAGERRNVKDKNPLRAAMIVFLMMKGGE